MYVYTTSVCTSLVNCVSASAMTIHKHVVYVIIGHIPVSGIVTPAYVCIPVVHTMDITYIIWTSVMYSTDTG